MEKQVHINQLPGGKKRQKKGETLQKRSGKTILFLLMSLMLVVPKGCNKDDNETKKVKKFHENVIDVVDATTNFVQKAVAYESAQFTNMTTDEIESIVDEYLDAGDVLIAAMQKILSDNTSTIFTTQKSVGDCLLVASGFFDVAGISPAMVIDISRLIADTRDTIRGLNQALQQQIIDENQYAELANRIKIENSLDGIGIGLSGGMAILTGMFTTLACGSAGLATLPALATVAVAGGTVGYGTYKLWSWYRGNKKSDGPFYMAVAEGVLGKPIPATLFDEGARMIIAIDGYAPVLIDHFPYPDLGHNMTIEIDAAKLSSFTHTAEGNNNWKSSEGMVEVCFFQELATGEDCEMLAFVSGYAIPPNPSPGQSVTVTGSVMPVTEGCSIHFSIVGTDGYSNSGTYSTNANGQANFGIPGAAPGVIDKVTITANGASYVVTYVFGGSSKSGENGQVTYRR